MPLFTCDGCVKNLFVTEEEFIERFTGKQLFLAGSGANGFLGNNSIVNRSSPVQTISSGTDWKQVSISCNVGAIKTDGSLWLWGANAAGQLGIQNIVNRSSPVQTVSNVTTWKQVSVGSQFLTAIKTDGTLWLWGTGANGQLGTGTVIFASSPVQTVSNVTTWKQVSAGISVTAAIKTDGSLWIWGLGTEGRLGNGTVINASSPVQTVSNVTTWKQVSVGGYHSAAIKTDGSLWLWGRNASGQLGAGTVAAASSPVQTVSTGTNWKLIYNGRDHSAAIKTDGSLWLWGGGAYGALGNNLGTAAASRSSPIQTISAGTNWRSVVGGVQNSGGIKTDGTLWLWGGNNGVGQFGQNSRINRSSPVQTISGGTDWRSVSIGFSVVAATCTV